MSLEEKVWRVIGPRLRDAAEIVAIDDVLHRRVSEGRSPPTLIFYHWEPSMSIGKPQAYTDLNVEACRERGIQIVRTPGGGRAVLHLGVKDISYSVIAPSNGLSHLQIYEQFCKRIAQALEKVGLPVEIDNINDFYINGKKVSGNALRLDNEAATQHGIILYEPHPPELMIELMNPDLYSERDIPELKARLTSIKEADPRITMQDLIIALQETLTDGKYVLGQLTNEEKREVTQTRKLYQNPNWFKGTSVRGLCWLSKGEPRGSLRGR